MLEVCNIKKIQINTLSFISLRAGRHGHRHGPYQVRRQEECAIPSVPHCSAHTAAICAADLRGAAADAPLAHLMTQPPERTELESNMYSPTCSSSLRAARPRRSFARCSGARIRLHVRKHVVCLQTAMPMARYTETHVQMFGAESPSITCEQSFAQNRRAVRLFGATAGTHTSDEYLHRSICTPPTAIRHPTLCATLRARTTSWQCGMTDRWGGGSAFVKCAWRGSPAAVRID